MRRVRSPAELGLTADDRHRLERALREARDARHLRRLLAVKLVAEGQSVADVARLCALSRPIVYRWLGRYLESHQSEVLLDRPRTGRPRGASRLTDTLLRRVVQQSPQEAGWATHGWTVPLLCTHLRQQGIDVSPRTLRRRLHEAGLRWKRPRYVYVTRAPHLAQKKGALSAV
ncbi:transposase [Pyxidicoccus parkwayensis]|uniref:Transposase n=2 Tax=Pyxidicoccus parkwayensis TaxID=2813578 RepID=A0ABX7P046_9BACT|nr:helix-turn-helix domain-containing protein [Pyxidicoccus parkwaysis]QSQ18706.1 transposase [Pyxidicoccus parkwaysis]QSQ24363.1 transposase [Pyxidicoccus parkwaysis]